MSMSGLALQQKQLFELYDLIIGTLVIVLSIPPGKM